MFTTCYLITNLIGFGVVTQLIYRIVQRTISPTVLTDAHLFNNVMLSKCHTNSKLCQEDKYVRALSNDNLLDRNKLLDLEGLGINIPNNPYLGLVLNVTAKEVVSKTVFFRKKIKINQVNIFSSIHAGIFGNNMFFRTGNDSKQIQFPMENTTFISHTELLQLLKILGVEKKLPDVVHYTYHVKYRILVSGNTLHFYIQNKEISVISDNEKTINDTVSPIFYLQMIFLIICGFDVIIFSSS